MINLKKHQHLLVPILYMLFIFVLSSIPMKANRGDSNITTRQIVQNVLHIPLFGLLAYLWAQALRKYNLNAKKVFIYTTLIVLTYAGFDEFHQSFIPGRYATLSDFILNVVGCVAGLALFSAMSRKQSSV